MQIQFACRRMDAQHAVAGGIDAGPGRLPAVLSVSDSLCRRRPCDGAAWIMKTKSQAASRW
jgi:hypothetical protein